jgi:propionyl-CoA synthetase
VTTYEELHRLSVEKPEQFWAAEAEKLHWYRKWDAVLDQSNAPFFRWFVGGITNLCYNAVDRHVIAGRKYLPAIIWESAETAESRILSFGQLHVEVNRFAGVLRRFGVAKGDCVVIYMPVVPEAMVAMLACARIGAVHCVVFAGFSAGALADRINDVKPKVIVCADAAMRYGKPIPLKPIVDRALNEARHEAARVIVLDRGIAECEMVEGRDIEWKIADRGFSMNNVSPEPVLSTEPSFILHTSGTSGKPRGIIHDTGGYMVALHTSMRQIYNCSPADVFWATSDLGWAVGHSYSVYGPLLFGIPTVLYEGTPDYPNPGIWWEIIAKHRVSVLSSSPTAIRILKKYPGKWFAQNDLSSLRYLFLAGEPLDEPTWKWATENLKVPVIDHYWQTETGWPVITHCPGVEMLPIKPGSPGKAAMGYRLQVVDDKGERVPPETKGFLVALPPLPPGTLTTIWNSDDLYIASYWSGPGVPAKQLYFTGDFASQDSDGYFYVLGRADEVIHVGGQRLGTGEVEELISGHEAVAEVSVVGIKDESKGETIAAFVVLKQKAAAPERVEVQIRRLVSEKLGELAVPSVIRFVRALPKTRSGKILRRLLKAICENKPLGDLSTVEDGATVDDIKKAVKVMGLKNKT